MCNVGHVDRYLEAKVSNEEEYLDIKCLAEEDKDMNQMVDEMNKLQNTLVDIGGEPIQLPQVILVGDQGCGKSTVLEGIIGKFLIPGSRPTRRPLILQLINFPLGGNGKEDTWIEFVHRPNKVFRDIETVSEEIEAETERLAGRNKGICSVPILIKYYSPKVMNFTIVDLPGLTRIHVGDQPSDIENSVKNHITKYIKYQNSIILPVVAANTDVETSEILQLARQADPSGNRTLCVVTKLDLMDAGTNATDVLLGNIVKFKMGIIGVVGRSQKDIDKGITITEVLKKEKAFLERNYGPIANKHGFPYLCEMLYSMFINSVKSALPEIEEKIQNDINGYDVSLLPFGKNVIDSQEGMLCFLTKFVGAYSDSVSGTCKNVGTYELEGGARIGYIFQEVFNIALESLDPLEGFDNAVVLTALRNSSGTKPSLFVPQHCFEQLVKKQIMRLVEPSVCCVALVQEELIRMSYDCDKELSLQMERFPKLRGKIFQVVNNLVKSRLGETTDMVENLINMHTAYINTAHPDFLEDTYRYGLLFEDFGGFKQFQRRNSLPLYTFKAHKSSEDIGIILNSLPNECILIQNMVTSYFNLIRKSIADAVPKIIMHFMVNYISDNLLTELVASIYSEGDPTTLLEEAPLIAAQRERVKTSVETLTRAKSVISDFIKLR